MRRILFRLAVMALTFAVGVCALWLFGGQRLFSLLKSSPLLPFSHRMREGGIEEEEYAVYAALINQDLNEENIDRLVVIRQEPSEWTGTLDGGRDRFYQNLKNSSRLLEAETVYDLRVKNEEHYKFARRLELKCKYVLVSEQELDGIFQSGAGSWEDFYQRYPGARGITTFSRVGFNPDRTQALVYIGYGCGGLCGSGGYLLLVKQNGRWVSEGGVGSMWIS